MKEINPLEKAERRLDCALHQDTIPEDRFPQEAESAEMIQCKSSRRSDITAYCYTQCTRVHTAALTCP